MFNFAWFGLFFGMLNPFLALIEILILLVLIVLTTFRFAAVSRVAAALNGAFWWLNRPAS